MQKTVAVIDIGNTSTTLGLYRHGRVIKMDRVPTGERSLDSLAQCLVRLTGKRTPIGAAVAYVVPMATGSWRRAVRRVWPKADWLEVYHLLNLGVGIDYPRPETIGADRLWGGLGITHER